MVEADKALQNIDLDDALRTILEGTAGETGTPFFQALVKNLCRALNTKGAWVTEYLEEARRLRSLAFWLGDDFVPHYEYDIAGTPCERVVEKSDLIHVPDRVVELYPNDPDLKPLDAVSYMGVPLLDVDGQVLGHLAVLHDQPLPEEKRTLTLFRIFAARAAAELRRLRAESQVREREEKLRLLIDSALDAIIELDWELRVTRTNAAVTKVFKCDEEEIVGREFSTFVDAASHEKLLELTRELQARPHGQQYLWIPEGLTAQCGDGETFPAEGSLSCFEVKQKTFYTLILRNVNERLQAEQRIQSLTDETVYLKEELKALHNFDQIIAESKPMLQLLHDVERVAATDATVLILGETGTGKELIARAVHDASPRREKPLIKVNCAAIPATLMESELFGHEKGAFTGAAGRRDGRFALADGGSIFLDEIGELPLDLQVKLLRVLQESEFEPVGSSQTKKVDVRVIAATNRNLEQEVKDGRFRQDLYYRLNVFPLKVPPLRAREDDVILLAADFAQKAAQRIGWNVKPLSPTQRQRLRTYNWPGNVRELQNVIERAVITSNDGDLNLERALPGTDGMAAVISNADLEHSEHKILTIKELQALERSNLTLALESCGWRVAGENGAARLLGIPPTTLSSRMKALGIQRPKS